jgi:hypothetical protein
LLNRCSHPADIDPQLQGIAVITAWTFPWRSLRQSPLAGQVPAAITTNAGRFTFLGGDFPCSPFDQSDLFLRQQNLLEVG